MSVMCTISCTLDLLWLSILFLVEFGWWYIVNGNMQVWRNFKWIDKSQGKEWVVRKKVGGGRSKIIHCHTDGSPCTMILSHNTVKYNFKWILRNMTYVERTIDNYSVCSKRCIKRVLLYKWLYLVYDHLTTTPYVLKVYKRVLLM